MEIIIIAGAVSAIIALLLYFIGKALFLNYLFPTAIT